MKETKTNDFIFFKHPDYNKNLFFWFIENSHLLHELNILEKYINKIKIYFKKQMQGDNVVNS